MKKTQWKELLFNIRHTAVSFTAIVLFVALGMALFTGIRWTMTALSATADADYTRSRMYHFELSCPLGFDDDYIASLTGDGIADEAEGYYETWSRLVRNGNRSQIRIVSLTEKVNRMHLTEGTLPAGPGEAAVIRTWATTNGVKIGDELTLEQSAADGLYRLTHDTLRVTGIVEAAEYMGIFPETNGISPLSPALTETVVYVTESTFETGMSDGYPCVAVRCGALDEFTTGSDAYKERSDELMKALEASADKYAAEKAERLTGMPGAAGYDPSVIPRHVNASFIGLNSVMNTFDKMQFSLVCLFVVIGILVCYSTVSMLIFDQTVLIGTKKANGFSAREVLRPFLIYAGIAAVSGSVIGVLLSRYVLEPVIFGSVWANYSFVNVTYHVSLVDAAVFFLLQFCLILISALAASFSISRQQPLALLKGETKAAVSDHAWLRRMPMWDRAPLIRKTIVRNFLNDTRRVIATLIGIMGCTALVITSLSAYDDMINLFDLNMRRISQYDTVMYFGGEADTKDALHDILDGQRIRYADVGYLQGAIQAGNGDRLAAGMYIPDGEAMYELFHLYDTETGAEIRPASGVWVNVAYKENYGAAVGDTLRFTDVSGQEHALTVEGFYDYYLMNFQLVLSADLYEREFGAPPVTNAILLDSGTADMDSVRSMAAARDGNVLFVDFYTTSKNQYDAITGVSGAITAMYIGLSVVLAVLVLLNLFTMLVHEKKTEVITLMINGFVRKDAEKYIYTDTKLLTGAGIAAGTAVGIVMGRITLESFNNIAVYFPYTVNLKACAVGIVFTAVLTYVMCRVALREVKTFSLSDINKM